LQRKLGYGSQDAYLEFRLVELHSTVAGAHVSRGHRRSLRKSMQRTDSYDSLEDGSSLIPKEEGIKCGVMVHCLFTNNGCVCVVLVSFILPYIMYSH